MEEEIDLKITLKHVGVTIAIVLMTFAIEYVLLRSLSVYNTTIGTYLLARDLLIHGIILGVVSLVLLLIAGFFKRNLVWGIYYLVIALGCLLSFIVQTNNGLAMDVTYTWVLNKTGFDMLQLRYLNGLSIAFTFVLVALLFLSDFRISYEEGNDGKKHLYVRSKLLALIRYLLNLLTGERTRFGDNADASIIAKIEGEGYYRKIKEARWNDKVRILSLSYGIWAAIKLVVGFTVASAMSNSFALRYLTIQTYLNKTGLSWFELLQRYMGVALMRFTGSVTVPATFAIDELITFEVFQLFQPLLFWFCIVWVVRLILGLIGDGIVANLAETCPHFASRVLSRFFLILSLLLLPSIMTIPSWVFDTASPYHAWQLTLLFGVFVCSVLIFRFIIRFTSFEAALEYGIKLLTKGGLVRRIFKVVALLSLIPLLLAPLIVSFATVEPYMQGRRYEYVWNPAYVPTIDFTRWAYELNEIERVDASTITTNETQALREIRIFTLDAAKLNMRSYVGAVNWMSIDPSDVDIIYINGTEYWTALLTLVKPPYQGDIDVWRTEHMLLTHSEKILAQDAATTKILDIREIFGLEETPQIYYGEGGLWRDVNEVYLNIPGFPETHLPEYQGPLSYNDEPDYVYAGFWRALKFYGMWRWDFAQGDYGDVSALVVRDVNERVSKVLLPGINKESDAYPVVDNEGNIHLLYWLWITRDSPHGYCDYPEYTQNQISRRFAIVLVNLKNGEIDGYLMNNERDDYILSFYRSFYPQWNKSIPDWLKPQMRYPEEFLERQIDVYNWYFQDDFSRWQRNEFYELTLDNEGNPIEDVRYIMIPINGEMTWCAVRLVEWYKGNTRNLAGMYVAPCGEDTGKLYFVDFEGKTIIGPSVALSIVRGNPDLTKHPYFDQWEPGNILMYSLGENFYYGIPYYKEETDMLLPQMVAVVNAYDQSMGFHVIQNPRDSIEVSMATTYAFQRIGVKAVHEDEVNGTLIEKYEYVEGGNSRWFLHVQTTEGTTVEVLAKVETLHREDISKIINLRLGDVISVRVDVNNVVTEVLS